MLLLEVEKGRNMNQKINEWLDAHQQDLLDDIKTLCRIPSVESSPKEGMPFGEEPCKALNKALELFAGYGFATHNMENYIGYADFDPSLPANLDMLAHSDVVPAGEGWTVTDPFTIIEKDGKLWGRGTSDDKGPMLCAAYAMRAIRETKTPLTKNVRLIVGSQEETGTKDIEHYYASQKPAPMTFSPDADFPIINVELGQFKAAFTRELDAASAQVKPRVTRLDAGIAINAVPQKAVVAFEGLELDMPVVRTAVAQIQEECGVEIHQTGDRELTIIGESAHASTPQTGRNAGLAAVLLINRLPLAECQSTALYRKIPELFPYGVTDGSALGIANEDTESGPLTATLDLFRCDEKRLYFKFDARTPLSSNEENCEKIAQKKLEEAGFAFVSDGMVPPHAVSADSDFIRTLLSAYEDVTGLKGQCLAIGGGTYVHDVDNGVAFGAVLPGRDTRMHGADEFFDIDNIMIAAKVYAEAIIRLCG